MKKIESLTKRGFAAGMDCLISICSDEEQKAADRISAAKALLDIGQKGNTNENSGAVRVILDGIPKEFLV